MDRKTVLFGLVGFAAVALVVVSYFVYSGGGASAIPDGGANALAVTISPTDHTLGNPKAPVTVVEYGAPTCPVCARWNDQVFPQFKANYIDTGKVYYVFRVFPLQQLDLAVVGMAQCLPREGYFQFLDMMWRNQSMWDPDGFNIPDIHAAIVHMGVIAGMGPSQVDTCINDQTVLQAASAVGDQAQKVYGINSTPSFIVNGQLAPYSKMYSWQGVQDTLDAVLKAKAGK